MQLPSKVKLNTLQIIMPGPVLEQKQKKMEKMETGLQKKEILRRKIQRMRKTSLRWKMISGMYMYTCYYPK